MKLPVELSKTMHKHGGRIKRIVDIGHEAAKPRDGRSQDAWYFVGDVQWSDGTESKAIEIAPYTICADEGDKEPEVRALLDLLHDYLTLHGSWCVKASGHEGWYSHVRPKIRRRA